MSWKATSESMDQVLIVLFENPSSPIPVLDIWLKNAAEYLIRLVYYRHFTSNEAAFQTCVAHFEAIRSYIQKTYEENKDAIEDEDPVETIESITYMAEVISKAFAAANLPM